MGEAFKRARAQAFQHRRHVEYQRLVNADLLTLARSNLLTREFSGLAIADPSSLEPNVECLLRDGADGTYEVVQGNLLVARVPAEARETVEACVAAAPSLRGVLPCRLARVGKFGDVAFVVVGGEDDE